MCRSIEPSHGCSSAPFIVHRSCCGLVSSPLRNDLASAVTYDGARHLPALTFKKIWYFELFLDEPNGGFPVSISYTQHPNAQQSAGGPYDSPRGVRGAERSGGREGSRAGAQGDGGDTRARAGRGGGGGLPWRSTSSGAM